MIPAQLPTFDMSLRQVLQAPGPRGFSSITLCLLSHRHRGEREGSNRLVHPHLEQDLGPPKMRSPGGKPGQRKMSITETTIDLYIRAARLSSNLLRLACAALSADELREWLLHQHGTPSKGDVVMSRKLFLPATLITARRLPWIFRRATPSGRPCLPQRGSGR